MAVEAAAEDEGGAFKGWAYVAWSKPEGPSWRRSGRLKALELTICNAPLDQKPVQGACLFTGDPAREYVLVGRATRPEGARRGGSRGV